MTLTNEQEAEIRYCEHRISLNKVKLQELEADAEILLSKVNSRNEAREYLIQGENIIKLKKETEAFEAKIVEIKNAG